MSGQNSKLKYVHKHVVKGRTYYRFRRKGIETRLPGTPGTSEFHQAYAKLLIEAPPESGRYNPGSVAHIIHLYEQSAAWSKLKSGTQRDYRRYLNKLYDTIGDKPSVSIDEAAISAMLDRLRDRRGVANHMLAVTRTLFKFALKRRLITRDPTAGAERVGGGKSYARWTDAEIEAFEASAPPMMRLAMLLGVYTGQRLSDAIALRWSDYDGKRIRLVQQKTGAALAIPAHPRLKTLLAETLHVGETILTSKSGLKYHSRVFSRDFMEARQQAGLPDGLSYHGLRHTAASRLAESGASGPEIQAITGHKTLQNVDVYIRQAAQGIQADRAIARLKGGKPTGKRPVKH